MVSDTQLAALRSTLMGGPRPASEILTEQDQDEAHWFDYIRLIGAAFTLAATPFNQAGPGAVVDYVADVRARSERLADELNPVFAERLLLEQTPARHDTADILLADRYGTHMLLLRALVADHRLSDEALEGFLAAACDRADRWAQGDGEEARGGE